MKAGEKKFHVHMDKLSKKIQDKLLLDLQKGKKLDREGVYDIVKKDIDAFLKENGISETARFYDGSHNQKFTLHAPFDESIKAMKRLSGNDKLGVEEGKRFHALVKKLGHDVHDALDNIEDDYKKSSERPKLNIMKEQVGKIVFSTAAVIGALVAVAAVIAVALLMFAPPAVLATAATVGITKGATFAIAGTTVGIMEVAGATAAVGTLVSAIGFHVKGKLNDKIDIKKAHHDFPNQMIIGDVKDSLEGKVENCKAMLKGIMKFKESNIGKGHTV